MKPTGKTPLNKNDVSHLIDMALGNKMPWSTLASLLKDISPYDSKEVIIESLLKALEKLHLKLEEMSLPDFEDTKNSLDISGNVAFADDSVLVKPETLDDDIEVTKETNHEEKECSNKEKENNALSEDDSTKRDKVEPVGKIEKKQSTFVGNKEKGNSETELPKENEKKQAKNFELKPFQCKFCHKMVHNLIAHERIHTGEKPHQCKTCKKHFREKSNLKRHVRTHTGEKPYHCNKCSKSFTVSSNLKTHERTHTGEMPFECKTCGKRFKHNSSLINHAKSHK